MKTWTILLKVTGSALFLGFLALLIWANWEPKPLHAKIEPIRMTLFQVDDLKTETAAARVREQMAKLPGVTACAANPESRLIAVTYHEDKISEAQLKQQVMRFGRVETPSFESVEPSGPQCPVPAEYLLRLERFKYALSFR
ncbi:heavy-metal-associated domain-containing protein [Larkinella soli]|uniref:heavy-metal-associated domain-containing protein n=1 Tax=Larkinella soli TaxID=1770527 RepID=UPI000FFB398A|nr:heavy-metal-associated domain-containing protein [Larkinella soli]